jgi:hypothetical protein
MLKYAADNITTVLQTGESKNPVTVPSELTLFCKKISKRELRYLKYKPVFRKTSSVSWLQSALSEYGL